jgi:hypothetical protein
MTPCRPHEESCLQSRKRTTVLLSFDSYYSSGGTTLLFDHSLLSRLRRNRESLLKRFQVPPISQTRFVAAKLGLLRPAARIINAPERYPYRGRPPPPFRTLPNALLPTTLISQAGGSSVLTVTIERPLLGLLHRTPGAFCSDTLSVSVISFAYCLVLVRSLFSHDLSHSDVSRLSLLASYRNSSNSISNTQILY